AVWAQAGAPLQTQPPARSEESRDRRHLRSAFEKSAHEAMLACCTTDGSPARRRHSAPVRDEQRDRLCHPPQRFEVDALIVGVDVVGDRPIDKSGNDRIEAEESRIGGPGEDTVFEQRIEGGYTSVGS